MNTSGDTDDSDDTLRFAAGEVIFNQGDEAEGVYIVAEGEVELSLNDAPIGIEYAGGIIGEMALINETARSATARAKTDCILNTIDRDRFLSLIQESPAFALHVMRVMADRIRRSNELAAS